jgi:uncharacterized protein (DUF1501 family)
MTADPSTAEILAALSTPDRDPLALSRRRFLQLALAAGAVAAVPFDLLGSDRAEAAPLGDADGVLVVLLMGGGNDGANMVVPIDDPAYAAARGNLAIGRDVALHLGNGLALHPALPNIKRRYDAGKVALLQGVGYPNPNLSHFESMALWMSGWAGGITNTGWVGRFLSALPSSDPMHGVVLGQSVPLHFRGPSTSALSLPGNIGGAVGWLATNSPDHDVSLHNLLARFDDRGHERGMWADAWNRTLGSLVALGQQTAPMYAAAVPDDDLVADMTLAARLVNLNVGTRVIGVSYGDFDTHANQVGRHNELMARFDAAVEAFFNALDPAFSGRVTVLTMSEFGRRAKANSSGGTDHGAASTLMAIGGRVRGGVYGVTPSMGDVDRSGNLKATTDFRSVYATAITWLGGNATAALGGDYGNLGFLEGATATPVGTGGGPSSGPSFIGPRSAFVPVTPARVLDTRAGAMIGYEGDKPAPGAVVTVPLSGVADIPAAGATAVVLNLTAAEADGYGYVTVWPGGPQPEASNLNLERSGQTRPNLVSATLGGDGATRLYTYGGTHLLADVFGYFQPAESASAGRLVPLPPTRLLDTRAGGAIGYQGDKPGAGATVTLPIAGTGGVPAGGAAAVVLNVTATEAEGFGYVTVYPDGEMPVASNLNVQHAGQTIANQVIVRLGADGAIRLFTHGAAHLLADVVGWFTDATAPEASDGLFVPVSPYRVLDTRSGPVRDAGSVVTLPVAAPGLPAAGARAIVLNVTAVDTGGWGYVSVFPEGEPPNASNLNIEGAGQTIANHVVCPVGSDGAVRLFTYGPTHLVADVTGWYV